jgi:hypothetical protein
VKLYLAGEREGSKNDEINVWRSAKRRLFSYYYHGFKLGNKPTQFIEDARHLDLFLDSGAFTAFTQKTTIPPEHYAQFVKDTAGYWSVCSSLDVIGEGEAAAQASWEMYQRLLDLGADVIPVFHVREPDKWLEHYIRLGVPYLAIGGMVPEAKGWLKDRLDGLWGRILTDEKGRARTQVHGFGLTTFDLMFRYPWYSVDSTSWLMTGVYGACVLPLPDALGGPPRIRRVFFSAESPQARRLEGWHYHSLTMVPDDPRRKAVDDLLLKYGVTAEQCSQTYQYRDLVNAAVYQDLEQFATEEFHISQPTLFQ